MRGSRHGPGWDGKRPVWVQSHLPTSNQGLRADSLRSFESRHEVAARVYKTVHGSIAAQICGRFYPSHIWYALITLSHNLNSKTMTDTFDPNFCFPVKDLENDWVKLVPFNVRFTSLSHCVTVY